jgi:hypothetical protein
MIFNLENWFQVFTFVTGGVQECKKIDMSAQQLEMIAIMQKYEI